MIVILILLVFGNLLEASINRNFPEFSGLFEVILKARGVISIAVMFFIFLFMYKIVSKKKGEKRRRCWIGAVFTSVAWYLISFFFSIYVNVFTDFSVIYGSLATIVLIMMWLYAIIYVILLGAEINIEAEKYLSTYDNVKKVGDRQMAKGAINKHF